MFTDALHDWINFYLLAGTAAATLIGLQFVVFTLVISLGIGEAMEAAHTFVTPTLVHFGAVLFLAGLVLLPAPVPWLLGGGLVLASLAGAVGLAPARRTLQALDRNGAVDRDHWLWFFLCPSVGYLLLLAAAAALLLDVYWSLGLVAAAAFVLLALGIHNAWHLILWIARRSKSES